MVYCKDTNEYLGDFYDLIESLRKHLGNDYAEQAEYLLKNDETALRSNPKYREHEKEKDDAFNYAEQLEEREAQASGAAEEYRDKIAQLQIKVVENGTRYINKELRDFIEGMQENTYGWEY